MFDTCLVVSDMDGTLLNHHDYQFKAALPMLERLEDLKIPVIFNTSKTFAELKDWVALLNNRHPFIVENGSAIYIPQNYFPHNFQPEILTGLKYESGYQVLLTGIDIQPIKEFLKSQKPDAIDLTQCSLEQAVEITGLSGSDATAAQNRKFSVPLLFHDALQQQEFSDQAIRAGFGILKGGRFLHVLGRCDKGQSMQVLKSLYEDCYKKKYGIIVLGDSPNDIAMLQQADVPVIVKSPSSASFALDHPATIVTQSEAPEGWVEGIETAFERINITLEQE